MPSSLYEAAYGKRELGKEQDSLLYCSADFHLRDVPPHFLLIFFPKLPLQ